MVIKTDGKPTICHYLKKDQQDESGRHDNQTVEQKVSKDPEKTRQFYLKRAFEAAIRAQVYDETFGAAVAPPGCGNEIPDTIIALNRRAHGLAREGYGNGLYDAYVTLREERSGCVDTETNLGILVEAQEKVLSKTSTQ